MQNDKEQNISPATNENKIAKDRELEIENGFFSIDDDENTKTHNKETIDKGYDDTLNVPEENEVDTLANKALKEDE